MRQLLVESLVVAAGGGAAAIVALAWTRDWIVSMLPADLPRLVEVRFGGARVEGCRLPQQGFDVGGRTRCGKESFGMQKVPEIAVRMLGLESVKGRCERGSPIGDLLQHLAEEDVGLLDIGRATLHDKLRKHGLADAPERP